ncbi:hypothetical protein [Krasilnikoviella flava]|uniref:Uncharacterized protein n=1 Tax=Krasilnikoviella flava TaxID=526729 RepID=A0A1T5LYT1_9MICO|nr:hypothetical protein [Krasilnikoviella flava]SKC81160.1 hypothetical protein SAMN04324258_4172 [Krasilnikoviella flava]
MSTVLKRVFANPRVTPGLVIGLLVTGALLWFGGGRALAEDLRSDWQFNRAQRWTPEPWALTADDFPGHDAVELAVEPSAVSRWNTPGWALDASRVPGLDLLFYASGPVGTQGYWRDDTFHLRMRTTDALAGSRVDGVDVLTYVSAPDGPSYATLEGARHPEALRRDALEAPQQLFEAEPSKVFPDPFADEELLSVAYVGHQPSEQERFEARDEPFDAGGPGYFGLVAHHRDAAGVARRTTTLATVVEGALVVVGVVVPDDVEPSADVEPALLLERLAAEVRAAPPSYPAAEDGGSGIQADSRTTSEVGSVMAAGS